MCIGENTESVMENYFDSILDNPGLDHITISIFESLDFPALLESMDVSSKWHQFIIENNLLTKKLDNLERYTLHNACINGHTKVVKLLLAKGFNGNAKDKDRDTPLNHACRNQNVDIVEILSKDSSINVNARGKSGNIPLMIASSSHMQNSKSNPAEDVEENVQSQMVQFLLQKPDINVNKCDGQSGLTALHFACQSRNLEVVKMLCQHPNIELNPTNRNGYFPFGRAASENDIKIVEILCQQPNFDVNYQYYGGKTGLHEACIKGNTDIVKFLCEHPNINVNVTETHFEGNDNTPIHYACNLGKIEVVKVLFEHPQIDVKIRNKKSQDALALATQNGYKDIVELLRHFIEKSKKSAKEVKSVRDSECGNSVKKQNVKDAREVKDVKAAQNLQNVQNVPDIQNVQDAQNVPDAQNVQVVQEFQDVQALQDVHDVQDVQDVPYLTYLLCTLV